MAHINTAGTLRVGPEERDLLKRHAARMRRDGEKPWRWQDSLAAAFRIGLQELAESMTMDAPDGE